MDSSSFQKHEKFKDSSPSVIDLFKEMHCSKNKGFSEQVKQAIVSFVYFFIASTSINFR